MRVARLVAASLLTTSLLAAIACSHTPDAPPNPPPNPPGPPESERPLALTAGSAHACALWPEGKVSCWGDNTNGQLGDGTTVGRPKGAMVAGLAGIRQIVAGGGRVGNGHTCALTATGGVLCFGSNDTGQLGDGTITHRSMPTPVAGLTDVVELALGNSHSCARKSDGTVFCWGRGDSGQLGTGGLVDKLTPVAVSGLADAISLSVGGFHGCSRRQNGEVACWGGNNYGELGNGSPYAGLTPTSVVGLPPEVEEVKAGGFTTCARTKGGAVYCWGGGEYGELGNGKTGKEASSASPLRVPGVADAVQLALGGAHVCARLKAGTVSCWGSNAVLQLGSAGPTLRPNASPVTSAQSGIDLVVGANFGFLRRTSEHVLGWGENSAGQLGDGTTEDRAIPEALIDLFP